MIGSTVFLFQELLTQNAIQGNYIGVQADGTAFPGDQPAGVTIAACDGNTIGGSMAGARNVIGGGVVVENAGDNIIQGNYIGTDATGMQAIANSRGIAISKEQFGRTPGEAASGNRVLNNIVASRGDSNFPAAVAVENAPNNIFQGNYVGVASDDRTALGNTNGFYFRDSNGNIVGGTKPGEGNVIAFNGTYPNGASSPTNAGITTVRSAIIINGNSIYANVGLGIDLEWNGVSPNQPGGALNHPELTSIMFSGGSVRVRGTLNGAVTISYRIELFGNDTADPSGFGEGQYYLGFTNVTTDASGNASFDVTFPVPSTVTAISSTSTGPEGTSEFSAATIGQLLNISTRADVQTGQNIVIGGFIVSGTQPKKVLLRAIGPSFNISGVPFIGRLADPVLQLFDRSGVLLYTNDNWKDTQRAEIEATGIPPTNDLESAIVMILPPGNYTAQMSGKNGGTGIGLVEVYDLTPTASALANISTRGLVGTNDNVMIGGFIVGPAPDHGARVLIRGLGPSLGGLGVTNPLQDPMIELHNANGALLASNDDWRTNQAQVQATGQAPTDDRESALVADVGSGNYTAVLLGKNSTTGVALVEVYQLP